MSSSVYCAKRPQGVRFSITIQAWPDSANFAVYSGMKVLVNYFNASASMAKVLARCVAPNLAYWRQLGLLTVTRIVKAVALLSSNSGTAGEQSTSLDRKRLQRPITDFYGGSAQDQALNYMPL